MIRLAVVALAAFVAIAAAGSTVGWLLGTLAWAALADPDSAVAWVRALVGLCALGVGVLTVAGNTERNRP